MGLKCQQNLGTEIISLQPYGPKMKESLSYHEIDKHEIGKRNTQKIERKNLNFRMWIKRLTRKTLCFSKLELMHDSVIGLLINKVVVDDIFMLNYRFHPLPGLLKHALRNFNDVCLNLPNL